MSTPNHVTDGVPIEESDYPALYQAADEASVSAQQKHLFIVRLYLGSLVLGGLFYPFTTTNKWTALIATILLSATLGLAVLQAFKDYEQTWYNGRAVAESVKTSTWRFMMRAEPYSDSDSVEVVRREFCHDLKQILKQNRSLAEHIGGEASTRAPISSKMNDVRSLGVEERLEIYNRERIDHQRKWYAKKYSSNKEKADHWFYGMIGLHAAAFVMLLIKIANPDLDVLPTQAAVIAGGSVLTWIRTKKYQENANAYSLTAHEIGIIKQEGASVESESELSDFVKDSENAFSREHTQWVARKDR